jgi:hypothetical protein
MDVHAHIRKILTTLERTEPLKKGFLPDIG